jgi:hypothetical protein
MPDEIVFDQGHGAGLDARTGPLQYSVSTPADLI